MKTEVSRSRGFILSSAGILLLAFFYSLIRLPLLQADIWMSPDETANAISGMQFAVHGTFGLPEVLPEAFAWLHPRSYVYVSELRHLAPVGFLGMPFTLSLFYKLFGISGLGFFTPLLVLITLYPFYRSLPKHWPRGIRFATLLVWISFPTVILYANRGLFPQLPVTCLAVWIWWALAQGRRISHWAIAGFCLGLAFFIRPPEAIWLIPLVIFALCEARDARLESAGGSSVSIGNRYHWIVFIIPLAVFLVAGAVFSKWTYGSYLISGYQIHESVPAAGEPAVVSSGAIHFTDLLPYGFHPRNILWNIRHYLFGVFLPWTIFALIAGFLAIKDRIWSSRRRWAVLALLWPAAVLVLFYGNGVYQDHIQLNEISIGNSFLRYLLPISLLYAVSAGSVLIPLWRHWPTKLIAACLVFATLCIGQWMAIARDQEGILSNEIELERYARIRYETYRHFPDGAVIFSDRSDKVFFPALQAVSPVPDAFVLEDFLNQTDYPAAVFIRTLDEDGYAAWRSNGIYVAPVFKAGNESLYEISTDREAFRWLDAYLDQGTAAAD